MFDFYSATIFLSVFIMIIMDMLVSGNDLMEHDKKQTVYTISVLVIACMVSEWFGVWMDGADPSLRTLHILVKTNPHTFPYLQRSFEYIQLYNQSVPVGSILSEVRTQMTCRVVHLNFFLSSRLHSINAASEK